MATIKEVAEKAGVSVATVSNILNKTKPAKKSTKDRVMKAVAELGYIPNMSARNLKLSTSSHVIGIVFTDNKSQFHVDILNSISNFFQQHNYRIQISFSNNNQKAERDAIGDMIAQNVDGLFLITCQPDFKDFYEKLVLDRDTPVILLEHYIKEIPLHYIGYSNYRSCYDLALRLFDLGYENIALFCGSVLFSSEYDCVAGFRDARAEFFDGKREDVFSVFSTNMTKEDAFQTYLKSFYDDPAEVFFCTSRETAEGVRLAAIHCGHKIPDDLIIINFGEETWDDVSFSSDFFTISRSADSLGENASEKMLDLIEHPDKRSKRVHEIEDKSVDEITLPAARKVKKNGSGIKRNSKVLKLLAPEINSFNSLKLLAKEFTRKTDTEVEFTFIDENDYIRVVSESCRDIADKFDLISFDTHWIEYLVQNKCLRDISGYIEDVHLNLNLFFEEIKSNYVLYGHIYGVPVAAGSQILFYREDLFADPDIVEQYKKISSYSLRPPRTWTEFNNIAKFFTRDYNEFSPTEYGTSLPCKLEVELGPEVMVRMWSYGGGVWNRYGQPSLSTVNNVNALKNIIKTTNYVEGDFMNRTLDDNVRGFCEGKTAMLVAFSESAQQICRMYQEKQSQVGMSQIPGKLTASAGWSIGLSPAFDKPEAYRFISWISDKPTAYLMTILNGFSQYKETFHNYQLQRLYPWLKYSEESVFNSQKRNPPTRKNWETIPPNSVNDIVSKAFRLAVLDQYPVDLALQEAQDEAVKIYKACKRLDNYY